MTGIRRYDISIGVSSLHGENHRLYVRKENTVFQVGQFKSPEDIALFFAALDYVAFGGHEDELRKLLQEREDNNADCD